MEVARATLCRPILIQLLVLLVDREMPVVAAPAVNALSCPRKAVLRRLESDHPVAIQRDTPIVSELEKVECSKTIIVVILPRKRRTKRDEFRLGWVDGQPKLTKAIRNAFHDAFGTAVVAEADNQIVRVADKEGIARQAWLHFLFEPEIEHIGQAYVRNRGPTNRANLRVSFQAPKSVAWDSPTSR